jgi:tetratricopeptide (TPR) repeat protein
MDPVFRKIVAQRSLTDAHRLCSVFLDSAGLLERALTLTRPHRLDVHAEIDLAAAHWGEPERAAGIAEEAAVRADEAGDETGATLARALGASHRFFVASVAPDELEELLLQARRRLEEQYDHLGLYYVWSALGYCVANTRGRADDWATASEQARRHSRLAGRSAPRPVDLGVAIVVGSRPADEALETVERLLTETRSPYVLLSRAWLLAMLDRSEEAWQDARDADARLREQSARWTDWWLAELSILDGDYEDASKRLRIVCDWLEATDQLAYLEGYLGRLGRSLCMLGRFDEAEQAAERARSLEETLGVPVMEDYIWRQVLARVHAHRGDVAEAERLAREAVAGSEQTDLLNDQCLTLYDLGEVLAAAGRYDEAEAALEQALEPNLAGSGGE